MSENVTHKPAGSLTRARARFLAQAIQLEEQGIEPTIKLGIYFSLFLFIAIVLWAALTQVNEVTHAKGEVVPTGKIYDVQHLEGGIISEILVRNGDEVQPGELLVRFAMPASMADFEQLQIKKASILLKLERIRAIEEGRQPDFSTLSKKYPALAKQELASYYAQQESLQSELAVLKSQSRQKARELEKQKNQLKALKKERALLQKQVDMRERLAATHVISQTDLLSSKSRLASVESQVKSVEGGISVAQMAMQEARQRYQEIMDKHHKENEFEVLELTGQLAEVEKALIKAEDKVNRLDVYAPIAGIVQGISITGKNAVVAPGDVILQIVPMDGNVIVEARILPEDIGHISVGQQAEVKIDSYDASKYGYVEATVDQISPSTYLDEKRNPYYLSRIVLSKNHLGDNPDLMKIIPGMTVQVSIVTGRKSILDYLLKPVTRGFSHAFQER
ncbi:HlyD family type I secretion periplasmic adaptor subunit [methane-oxidizing endosymbiont of Gigantopelta aegis]|uniref:HlyD family type I secretion periplasmic adaptor subunit n=1 Tax=methane-oxidizing endosymbiont of Gigantopelta aegis TaxID=2794938 RepID=UPI0018DEB024|nr:HlyD family type I secretion periplasmic adaptor subunit [methane-oxidizing endosymbiont of Gigantopelta aegis]